MENKIAVLQKEFDCSDIGNALDEGYTTLLESSEENVEKDYFSDDQIINNKSQQVRTQRTEEVYWNLCNYEPFHGDFVSTNDGHYKQLQMDKIKRLSVRIRDED
ncbi:hypothetical protein CHS0354_033319 [Potamilus streckersoni]|uniref:Uncharacterized protein n=1 Tax=Potamilus streckersoni TaxID=2493646 RepID=A0AAE0RTH4_9BIVA|nr:hypothetical protein CHS0354_033319 [Potamilus streckersoni]